MQISMNHCSLMIQVDAGGHPPIPLRPPQLSLTIFLVSLIVAQFTIFSSFLVPELRSRFEALNDIFLGKLGAT